MPTPATRRLVVSVTGAVVAGLVWASGAPGVRLVGEVGAEAATQRFVESRLWLAPESDPLGASDLARGVELLINDRPADGLAFFSRELKNPVLATYARFYVGRAQFALKAYGDAVTSARQVIQASPGGALGESALWLLADALERGDKWAEAVPVWQTISGLNVARTPAALLRLGLAADKINDVALARGAYARIHYDFPASPEADAAGRALARPGAVMTGSGMGRLELGRAEKLFAARRYADARKAFEALKATAAADERPLVALRLAQTDFHLQRFAQAREALESVIAASTSRNLEAEFYLIGTLRGLKRDADYVSAVSRFAAANPTSTFAEAALNELATWYILASNDEQAAAIFTEMYAKFPTGTYADRAAWKAGWWAYKQGNRRETIRLFESAAVAMRRADYRPSWLYWAARSHEELGEREAAVNGYRQTVVFYRNSYYGREATRGIARLQGARGTASGPTPAEVPLTLDPGVAPPNAPLIRALLVAGLNDDAVAELRKVQAESGTSPLLEATIAYALNRKGDLRPGITAMRRAYPQFMAAGGEQLPRRILGVIFPIAHWDLLRKYATDRELDLFLLTALVAQESTFQADVRSAADAWGLMQLLPSTGRRYATKVGVRGFTVARLTDPETNVRLGTAYLSDLLRQFGGDAAPALAAYNAGEGRVVRWRAERPGIPRDEFVDDIPFPETQNYVKRIIGTAEDYRLLYAHLPATANRQTAR